MTIHIPWAETAQLSEPSTDLNHVGTLRECVARYAELDETTRRNVLIISDADVPLSGRRPTKILEHEEIDWLLARLEPARLSTAMLADLLAA